jgi:F-type H+-transporting ATPase subunit a
MDHHTSWFSFLPGYQWALDQLNDRYRHTIVYSGGIMPEGAEFATLHHVVAAALVALILLVLSLVARARLNDLEKSIVPPSRFGVVAFFELVIETVLSMMKGILGHEYRRYAPVILTFALFILVSNLLGLVPGFVPPTDNLNTTLACGVIIFVYFNFHGLRVHGIKHITHLANPVGAWWGWLLAPLMLPVELISLCVRPISLGLRLAGNMTGDHMVLLAFAGIMPLVLPLPFYVLGLLICIIQTAVFCILSCVYISLHTAEEEGH